MSTKKALAAAALLVAGATGQALYTSTTSQQARQEIAAAHDVSTRHGELTVRADAGGADVTALVAVTPPTAPGQVFTADDAGLAVWRALPGGVSLAGTGVVEVRAGDAGTVDAAGAPDAAVLTLLNGVQGWQAAGASGPVAGRGTYASRPASPAVGDTYYVSSGSWRGSRYVCRTASSWTLDAIDPILDSELWAYDPERLPAAASNALTLWPDRAGLYPASVWNGTVPDVVAPATGWVHRTGVWPSGGGGAALHSSAPYAQRAIQRTIALVVSDVYAVAVANAFVVAFGGTNGNGAIALGLNRAASPNATWVDTSGSALLATAGGPPTASTPVLFLLVQNASNIVVSFASLAASSPSWTTAMTEANSTTAPSYSIGNNNYGFVIGARYDGSTSYSYRGTLHWIGAYAGAISSTDRDTLNTRLYERLHQ